MTDARDNRRELEALLATICDQTPSPEDLQRIEALADNPKDLDYVLNYLQLDGLMRWEFGAGDQIGSQQSSTVWAEGLGTSGQYEDTNGFPSSSNPQSLIPNPSLIPPIVIDPSPASHSPFGSFVFSHVAAAVILGIGLLIGLAWRISSPSVEGPAPNHQDTPIVMHVGRITALADCEWSKQGAGVRGPGSGISEIQIPKSPNPQIPVFLGDRFQLVSGLMEITYNTGAKVLLQGPCTYEIDSSRGGFLVVGKLTALVEKGSGNANHSPLFAVRTPMAIVTDLGTEFGVEVEKSGATRSHVFQGTIEVRSSNSRELTTPGELVEILHAGESARVERGRNSQVAIKREPGQPDCFVRRIPNSKSILASPTCIAPKAYAEYVLSLEPVAYYRMELPKSKKDRLVVFDSAPGGHHGEFRSLDTSVSPYTAGCFGDAMTFRGNSVGDHVMLPTLASTKSNPLTVVAWVMLSHDPTNPLVVFGRWGSPHQDPDMPGLLRFIGCGAPEPVYRWHHMAYVINDESGETVVHMYQDGIETKTKRMGHVWPKLNTVFWGIGGVEHQLIREKAMPAQYWQGQIDEVAIFNRVLPAKTIEQLYLGGVAAPKGDRKMNDP